MIGFLTYVILTGAAAAVADTLLPPDDANHDYNGAYPPRNLCVGVVGLGWPLALPVAIGYLSFHLTKQTLSKLWIK